jgi:hydroxypyruvate reductase
MSTGETTVTVGGRGRGGRNQEFGLALVDPLAALNEDVVVASVATDGVDGPTEAAGAIVDGTTLARSRELDLGTPRSYLDRNDSFTFFQALGDILITGPTHTNVGDLQVFILLGSSC